MAEPILVITGPTGVGKTDLSLAVAERIGGEIVSMDSRQVYRHMDVGTAKATAAEQARVSHHLIDVVAPGERFSAGDFARAARTVIQEIRARGRVPILVGGTGFFLRALTHPLFQQPPLDDVRRGALHAFLERLETAELERWLRVLDPALAAGFAGRAGGGGRQRLVRGLEVALLTGRPLSWWHAQSGPPEEPLPVHVIVLDRERQELYRRIDDRARAMAEGDLPAEVDRLRDMGYDSASRGMNATGYPEIAAYRDGSITLDDAIDRIQRTTRGYARRQLTWFRNQLPSGALWLDAGRPPAELLEEIVRTWQQASAR